YCLPWSSWVVPLVFSMPGGQALLLGAAPDLACRVLGVQLPAPRTAIARLPANFTPIAFSRPTAARSTILAARPAVNESRTARRLVGSLKHSKGDPGSPEPVSAKHGLPSPTSPAGEWQRKAVARPGSSADPLSQDPVTPLKLTPGSGTDKAATPGPATQGWK